MLSCVFAKAQTEGTYSGFSPYSVYGVGNLHTPGTAWNRGMGGVGIAARNHRFRISLFSEGDKRALNTTFNIDDFTISFPMWNHTAFMVGINPLSDVGYKIAYSELSEDNLTTGRQSFSSIGNGGVYQIFAAAGGTFWNRLSVGAQVNYSFGNINKKAAMSYEDEAARSWTTGDSLEAARSWTTGDSLQVNNVTAKIGLQYEQPVGRGSSFILGATYKFSTAFTGYHIHYEQMGVYRNSKTDNLSTSGLRMGDELGIGISYKKGEIISW